MRDLAFDIDAQGASASTPALLEARNLSFEARGQRLIDGIDLRIQAGRRTAIMGANGAGKSLLLRLLHGLIAPSAGSVAFEGQTVARKTPPNQAMVFQRPVLLRRSVRGNLKFALSTRGITGSEGRQRVEMALARARLTHLARRPARTLSGGEQQRLAVARALACEPDLLFLDEPTANLDPASTHAVEELIREAHECGTTIVLVTHDVRQAYRVADDVVFLDRGRIVETGPIRKVLTEPMSHPIHCWMTGKFGEIS